MSKKTEIFLITILFIYSFTLRLWGLSAKNPFWVDEYSTAFQARLINTYGPYYFFQSDYLVEHNNLLTHLITAISFKTMGENVSSARYPFVFIGSLVPVLTYLTFKNYFGKSRSFLASLVIATSNLEILWSVQSRSYVLIQLFSLLTIYFLLVKKSKITSKFGILSILFGLLSHKLFVFQTISVIFINIHNLIAFIRKHILSTILYVFLFGMLALNISYFSTIVEAFQKQFVTPINNLWYYHSYLWRGYSLQVIFSLVGIYAMYKKDKKLSLFLISTILLNFIFICFFFVHYHTKYLLPIFHYFIILFSCGIFFTIDKFNELKKYNRFHFIDIVFIIFIILNGYKFTYLPKTYYSLNDEMREVSNIDYDQIYSLVKNKLPVTSNSKVCMVDTWIDRARWYFKENEVVMANFRWENAGPRKITSFYYGENGFKYIPKSGPHPVLFISSQADLELLLSQCSYGFIFIDDSTLPADVIAYANEHFKKELYLDHYQYDDNPHSIWPATLYSWGFDDPE